MSEDTVIQFNSNYIDLIKNLTSISPQIIFTKDEEQKKIIVNRTNKGRTIFFKVEVPESFLTFSGEKIAFYNFGEFYQLMNAFGTSKLLQKENKIIIETPIGKIYYVLSAPETLAKSPSKVNLTNPDIVFNLSSETLGELKKINTLLNAKYANVSIVEKNITLKLFNSTHDNSFDKAFTPESFTEGVANFDFSVYSEIFSKIPSTVNYKVSVFNKGFMFFSFLEKDIDFLAITARVKKMENGEANSTEPADTTGEPAPE